MVEHPLLRQHAADGILQLRLAKSQNMTSIMVTHPPRSRRGRIKVREAPGNLVAHLHICAPPEVAPILDGPAVNAVNGQLGEHLQRMVWPKMGRAIRERPQVHIEMGRDLELPS